MTLFFASLNFGSVAIALLFAGLIAALASRK